MRFLSLISISQLKNNRGFFIYLLLFCLFSIRAFSLNADQEFVDKEDQSLIIPEKYLPKLSKTGSLREQDMYDEAILYNLHLFENAKKNNDQLLMFLVNREMALIKIELSDLYGAQELFLKNLELLKNVKEEKGKQLLIENLNFIAKTYIDLKMYNLAKKYAEDALNLNSPNNNSLLRAQSYCNTGAIYTFKQNYKKAVFYLDKALAEYKKANVKADLTYLYKSYIFYEQLNYKASIESLSTTTYGRNNYYSNYLDTEKKYSIMAKSYDVLEDNEKAAAFFEHSLAVLKDVDNRRMKVNTALIGKFDQNLVEEEINTLSGMFQKRKTYLYLLIIIGVLIGICFLLINKNMHLKNERKYKALIAELNNIEKTKKPEIKAPERVLSNVIEAEKIKEILDKLKVFETEKGFLEKNLTQSILAKKLDTNTNYLSKIINHKKGVTFTSYLAELRVNYAILELRANSKFRSYNISAIAREVGFNSTEPFSKAFKNKTGLNPSYFIKKLEEEYLRAS